MSNSSLASLEEGGKGGGGGSLNSFVWRGSAPEVQLFTPLYTICIASATATATNNNNNDDNDNNNNNNNENDNNNNNNNNSNSNNNKMSLARRQLHPRVVFRLFLSTKSLKTLYNYTI